MFGSDSDGGRKSCVHPNFEPQMYDTILYDTGHGKWNRIFESSYQIGSEVGEEEHSERVNFDFSDPSHLSRVPCHGRSWSSTVAQ